MEVPNASPENNESGGKDRDVIVGKDDHKANQLLCDLTLLHKLLWRAQHKEPPKSVEDVSDLSSRLYKLMAGGRKYELGGLKDVPTPFHKGPGKFIKDGKEMTESEATQFIAQMILDVPVFGQVEADAEYERFKSKLTKFTTLNSAGEASSKPQVVDTADNQDIILLRCDVAQDEEKNYEHQNGNKNFFRMASQYVTSDANESLKRIESALTLVEGDNPISDQSTFQPRFLSQDVKAVWSIVDWTDVAEFAVIFTYEVFLEKQMNGAYDDSKMDDKSLQDTAKPSQVPVENPTSHDVLFGRGGMTNNHPGNRRFRDIIALHRPDYIRAVKVDKPNVARKIVRAIRCGNPPGRFMKKGDDGKWYDVGDRTAAEKTSQGLRERTNAEKRQRSALREALGIRKEDFAESSPKKQKALADSTGAAQVGDPTNAEPPAAPLVPGVASAPFTGVVPLSLNMKDVAKPPADTKKPKVKSEEGDPESAELPPNAVDDEGNILVTDYDILCGRGGLTNHHKGNKRFRDIVALHRPDYVRAPKIQKPAVARMIVRAIRNGDPPGRFLKKDDKSGKWIDIGDKRAAEKASQALREKSNDEREASKKDGAPCSSGHDSPLGTSITISNQAVMSPIDNAGGYDDAAESLPTPENKAVV